MRPHTLAEAIDRIRGGASQDATLAEFIDTFDQGDSKQAQYASIEQDPALTGNDRLDALVGANASADTRQKFRKMLREGALDDREIEITVQESAAPQMPTFDIPGIGLGQPANALRRG